MTTRRLLSAVWIVFLLGAVAVVIGNSAARARRLEYLAAVGATAANAPVGAGGAAPGDAELTPNNTLPIPDQLDASYHWLAQTERMLNRGEVRVRHIDYENAPYGREVLAPSPYRWWLGLLAWCEHRAHGAPAAAMVERAAVLAGPLLWGLILAGAAMLAARCLGSLSAALLSVGLVSLFPFVTGYAPGSPDDRGLAQGFAVASALILTCAAAAPVPDERATRRWFILAAVAGGLGLWIKVAVQLPVLWGITGGGLLAAFLARGGPTAAGRPAPVLPWRAWGCAGAATTILASLIEYSPSELRTGELSLVHPLLGLAWLGVGELLAQVSGWLQGRPISRTRGNLVTVALACALAIAVPVVLLQRHGPGLFLFDSLASRLTRRDGGIGAANLTAWMTSQGPSIWLWLTLAPLGGLFPILWVLNHNQIAQPVRAAVAISLGPVLAALVFACAHLAWWQTLDALLLVSLATAAAGIAAPPVGRKARLGWVIVVCAVLAPGLIYVLAWDRPQRDGVLSRTELQELILRDLAGWISQHSEAGSVIVLSPPAASVPLCYYGAFRGLGSLSDDNQVGVGAAIRIMTTRNLDEAKEMVAHRKITHIVLLSWDKFYEDFARDAAGDWNGTLVGRLGFATLPRWLRPLAYPLPGIPGFEDQAVTVLKVVDDQDEATALSNIALYFAEVGDLAGAQATAAELVRFVTDFGAWVARAQVAVALHDQAELTKDLKVLQSRLALRVQPLLSWERRVDLAVVLARARETVLAKAQLTLCIKGIDDDHLRSLSPGSVYRLLVLSRGLGVALPPAEHELALSLVSPALRSRLQ